MQKIKHSEHFITHISYFFISFRNLGATAATWEGYGSTLADSVGVLHYQYGRTAPMPATLGSVMANIVTSSQTFAWAVKNPITLVAVGWSNWSTQDGSASYMWSDKNVATDSDGKSIFDPSPIGWRLPIISAYSDFPANCSTVSDNVATYTLGTTGTASFYAVGHRHPTSANVVDSGTNARFWTSTPSSSTRSCFLRISSYISLGNDPTAGGYTVRPVRE